MGPGNHTYYSPHCLRRDFSPYVISTSTNQSILEQTLNATDFWHLDFAVEAVPLTVAGFRIHAGGHLGIGGQIGEVDLLVPIVYGVGFLNNHLCSCLTSFLLLVIRYFIYIMVVLIGCGGLGNVLVSLYIYIKFIITSLYIF